MELLEIYNKIKDDLANKRIYVDNKNGYRVYTDGLSEVPITSKEETARLYEKVFIIGVTPTSKTVGFNDLHRCNIFVGQPDTGKTYRAQKIAEDYNVDHILIMARDNLNIETLLEDFTIVNGQPVFQESLAIKMLSGTQPGLIIIDEFNTLLTGVMKTLQPLLDETSKTFEYKGKIYNKNFNCKFILTLNDKDKGISVIPDAILSRSKITYFEQPDVSTLAQWSNLSPSFVDAAYNLYKSLGLLSVFGTRQLKALSNMKDEDEMVAHFKGLCSLRGMDGKLLDTIETKRVFTSLCTML